MVFGHVLRKDENNWVKHELCINCRLLISNQATDNTDRRDKILEVCNQAFTKDKTLVHSKQKRVINGNKSDTEWLSDFLNESGRLIPLSQVVVQ